MDIIIRNERPEDHRAVEEIIKCAFWNVNVPGCNEHYLAHILRDHPDFVPELNMVAEIDGSIVGQIMYTVSKLIDETGQEKTILTFGPLSVLPAYQRRGIGKRLMDASFAKAIDMGFDAVVIFGNPDNYVSSGFKSSSKLNIYVGKGFYPAAMLAKELRAGVLSDGKKWRYEESAAFEFDEKEADKFDCSFPFMEKGWQPSQEMFYVLSRSALRA